MTGVIAAGLNRSYAGRVLGYFVTVIGRFSEGMTKQPQCLGTGRIVRETPDCFADDLGALAKGEAYFVLPRLRIVREGGQRDGGNSLGFW